MIYGKQSMNENQKTNEDENKQYEYEQTIKPKKEPKEAE